MEEWRKVKGFDEYEVSNYGRVRSLKFGKERILKPGVDSGGYYTLNLFDNGKQMPKNVHKLVAIAFLRHIPCGYKLVVNHKDFNKLNNRLDNLELISQRENANLKHIKSSSKYVGVCWNKNNKKWMAYIKINKNRKYLGLFHLEIEANNAYQNALKELNNKII